jgi:signal transduction histidine kinase
VGVRGALAMLEARQAEHGDARGRGLVRLARANADRLMRCVTDLLDLEHIRGGAVAVTLRPTSPGDVAHAAVEAVTPLAAERRVRVTVRETPCGAALADHHQAAQALITLVSNCVYAAHPDATLRVATTRVAGARVRIAVEDAGGAIPPERRAALVRRIDRVADAPAVAPPPLTLADALLATGAGGTEAGLGLAIARALVERQGGTLGASIDADRAAVCWVEFPAAEEVFAALALLE